MVVVLLVTAATVSVAAAATVSVAAAAAELAAAAAATTTIVAAAAAAVSFQLDQLSCSSCVLVRFYVAAETEAFIGFLLPGNTHPLSLIGLILAQKKHLR